VRATKPPAFATWLLRHLGSSPHNDAIIGDLIEQYEQAPSSVWYWKQCLKAIAVGLFNECRGHKFETVRALLIGWAVLFIYFKTFEAVRDLFAALQSWSRSWRHDWLLLPFFTLDAILFCFTAGWLIARLHRSRHVPMVLIFTISSCCVAWIWFVIAIGERLPFIWPPHFVFAVATNLLVPVSIVAGGGLLRRSANR
jgi:hypothetical protein